MGLNPEVGHEEMASLNYAHGIAQALWHGKLFHIDLNGQHGPATTRTFASGPATCAGPSGRWTSSRRRYGPRYDGYVHFDYKPPRTEDIDDVWDTARACMRNYLILREKVRAFRPTPRWSRPWRRHECRRCPFPPSPRASRWKRCAKTFDVDAMAARGMHFERLDQLAMEHLLGVR